VSYKLPIVIFLLTIFQLFKVMPVLLLLVLPYDTIAVVALVDGVTAGTVIATLVTAVFSATIAGGTPVADLATSDGLLWDCC